MNKAANIVASSIIGAYYKEVKLGRFTFKIYQPTVKDMCLIFGNNGTSVNENMKGFELIAQMPEHINECARALSYAVSLKKSELFRKLAYQYIMHYAALEQIEAAFYTLAYVINGKELFDSVKKDLVQSQNSAESVGGNSIFGAMCSLMENLHLSHKEAFEIIPYPVMLMMNADKIRPLSGGQERMVEVTGEEFLRIRQERRNNHG